MIDLSSVFGQIEFSVYFCPAALHNPSTVFDQMTVPSDENGAYFFVQQYFPDLSS